MSGLPSGGFACIDNDWLSAVLPSLAIAEALRLYLQAKAGLRQKGADLGELISATGNRDVRHTERAIKKLTAAGLIVLTGKLYYAPAASPATATAVTTAQSTAATPANTSFSHDADTVPDGKKQIENSPEEVEEEKRDRE